MSRLATATVIAASLTLAACQTAPTQRASIAPVQPRGIEGTWNSVAGPIAYTATFQNGRFTSNEAATGAVLANGNYTQRGSNQIGIDYTSVARNQQISVNCNRMSENRLSCVNSGGTRFDLVRSA